MKKIKKIILTRAPGTGKSSIINKLKENNYKCFNEVWDENFKNPSTNKDSNQIIDFSRFLFDERKKHFEINEIESNFKKNIIFYDRSLIDIISYLKTYNKSFPKEWTNYINLKYYYNKVFYCPLWSEIYVKNKMRLEEYDETINIDKNMRKLYKELNYNIIEIPKKSINERVEFILDNI